jgi:uncharacterized SAM-binding protein YcdF (DUF218 family)
MLRELRLPISADVLGGATPAATAGISLASAAQFRRRLIASGVIEPAGRGKVRFVLPSLQKYLQSSDQD